MMKRSYMLSIYQLMKYLRNTHHINVKSSRTFKHLKCGSYYHGFKRDYRFIREDTNRVNFSSLDDMALNKYDMRLKQFFI